MPEISVSEQAVYRARPTLRLAGQADERASELLIAMCVTEAEGGMSSADREAVKTAFQSGPEETPVRILLATDAASEGLNLQNHCRYLIHYEIPWNPNKMEQRNGRIDRHGQPASHVWCYHFLYHAMEDRRFLDGLIVRNRGKRGSGERPGGAGRE